MYTQTELTTGWFKGTKGVVKCRVRRTESGIEGFRNGQVASVNVVSVGELI